MLYFILFGCTAAVANNSLLVDTIKHGWWGTTFFQEQESKDKVSA